MTTPSRAIKPNFRDVRRGRAFAAGLGLVLGAAVLSGCTPIRDYRGFVAQEDTLAQIQVGMARADVDRILGTPSATSTIDGRNYYYISSIFETTAFFEPEEIERRVVAVRFDDRDSVAGIADYGLRDGKIFDFISRTTPTRGKELTFLQQMFGNIGRFGSDGSALNRQLQRGGGL